MSENDRAYTSEALFNYVNAPDVSAALVMTGVDEATADIAAGAVRTERAQWVVDEMVCEIGRRAILQAQRVASLKSELTEAQEELDDTYSVLRGLGFTFGKEQTEANLRDIAEKRELLRGVSPMRFKHLINKEPSFEIILTEEAKGYYAQTPRYTLNNFIADNREYIKAIFGNHAAFSLASRTLWRFIQDTEDLQGVIGEGVIEVESTESQKKITIIEPNKFFDFLFYHRNFGTKTAWAILVTADVQALTLDKK